jgi:type II secretory pathway component PulJ
MSKTLLVLSFLSVLALFSFPISKYISNSNETSKVDYQREALLKAISSLNQKDTLALNTTQTSSSSNSVSTLSSVLASTK